MKCEKLSIISEKYDQAGNLLYLEVDVHGAMPAEGGREYLEIHFIINGRIGKRA